MFVKLTTEPRNSELLIYFEEEYLNVEETAGSYDQNHLWNCGMCYPKIYEVLTMVKF